MKRRFEVTLLAVAIAVFGVTAYGSAPTIENIPSPVIADDVPATNANMFVYPDVFDLDEKAEDNNVAPEDIIWSYAGTGRYRINDRDPIDLGNPAESPNSPGSKEVGADGLIDPDESAQGGDGVSRTITFRDATLSPVGGTNTDPDPGPNPTTQTVHSEVVTLIASDGATYSMQSFLVYTESNGRDRLSGQMTNVLDEVPSPSGPTAWSSFGASDTAVLSGSETDGLCIDADGPGQNFAGWRSPYQYVNLVQNNVYRFRLQMETTSALPAGATGKPFWDFFLENFNDSGTALNRYQGGFSNFHNEGGANAVLVSGGRESFTYWWAPPAVNSAAWNDPSTGMFTAANDDLNDMRMTYRVLDVDNPGFNAADYEGELCLRQISVDRMPFDQLQVSQTLYENSSLTADNTQISTVFGDSTTIDYTGGELTLSPDTGGSLGQDAWDTEVINIDPATGGSTDVWPVPWTADTLLMGTVSLEADGTDNPPDGIALNWDQPTNELIHGSAILNTDNTFGAPVAGSVTDYVGFAYTHNVTASGSAGFDAWRLRLQLLLTENFNSGGQANNLGGVIISNMKVEEVDEP